MASGNAVVDDHGRGRGSGAQQFVRMEQMISRSPRLVWLLTSIGSPSTARASLRHFAMTLYWW